MKDRNNEIAIDKFRESINENIDYIIKIAYKAGLIENAPDGTEKTCKDCKHSLTENGREICVYCSRLKRDDLYTSWREEND